MDINTLIQYGALIAALLLLWVIRSNIKKYVPVGIFASSFAIFVDHLGSAFRWWNYGANISPGFHGIHISLDYFVIPALVMTFVKYVPRTITGLVLVSLIGSLLGGGIEYLLSEYTDIIEFHNGYLIWYSLLIWLLLWPSSYAFHVWIWDERFIDRNRIKK